MIDIEEEKEAGLYPQKAIRDVAATLSKDGYHEEAEILLKAANDVDTICKWLENET